MGLSLVSERGQRIKELRNQHKMSQTQLANAIGTTQQTITDLERGATGQSKYISKIAKLFSVEQDYIETGEKPKGHQGFTNIQKQEIISLADESLKEAITSVKAIQLKKKMDIENLDPDLVVKAFNIVLETKLTGDYVLSALGKE